MPAVSAKAGCRCINGTKQMGKRRTVEIFQRGLLSRRARQLAALELRHPPLSHRFHAFLKIVGLT